MKKSIVCAALALSLLLTGCVAGQTRNATEPTDSPEQTATVTGGAGVNGIRPGNLQPPEGDYQLPEQPEKPIKTQ